MANARITASLLVGMFFLCVLATLLSAPVYSQTTGTTGTVTGVVTDQSGAVIPDCSIKVKNEQTGLVWSTQTQIDGTYLVSLLPTGIYSVEASLAGFKTLLRTGVTLAVQQTAKVDMQLAVGEVTENVNVSGEAPLVETRQASIGATMDSKRMTEIPLSGRSPASLLALIPTVTNVDAGTDPVSLTVSANVAGGRAYNNNFLLDDARYNSAQYNEGNPLPPPDMVDQFVVVTNSYDAEKGMASAATIQVVTKSGTNDLHGSLFEFHRDNALTARNFFSPDSPFLIQNQFGGSVGGPIRKNKTFFFASYQGTRIREAVFSNSAYPATAAERKGDFSNSVGGLPNDPETGLPFLGGIIPESRWDPASVKYLTAITLPNTPDGRYESTQPLANTGDMFLAKVDHTLTSKDRLSGRYWFDYGRRTSPNSSVPFGFYIYSLKYQNANLTHTHTFNASMINTLTVSYNRKYEIGNNKDMPFETPAEVGVNTPDPLGKPYPPSVNVIGRVGTGPGIQGLPMRQDNTWDFGDTFSWTKGRSAWKFGVNYTFIHFGRDNPNFTEGLYDFNGQYTGNAMADFLIGRPSFLMALIERENHRNYFLGFFAQNDYRVSSRLTLNFGVRYHYEQPVYQIDGQEGNFVPGYRSKRFPGAPLGMAYYGDPGVNRGIIGSDKNNFTPRIGFAWDVFGDGKTSVRGGFGIFTQPALNGHAEALGLVQPFLPILTLSTVGPFHDPLQGGLGFNVVPGNPWETYNPETGEAVFVSPVSGWGANPNEPNAYVTNYSLSVQRQLPQSFAVTMSYVGSTGRKLPYFRQGNPAIYGPGATLDNTEERRLYNPGQVSGIYYRESGANSGYNAMSAVLERRFTKSYMMNLNYTWSRSLDMYSTCWYDAMVANPFDARADRGLSDFHRSHVFAASGVWDLPRLSSLPTVAKAILGDWELTGMIRLASGMPFSVPSGRDNSLSGVNRDRADLVGDPNLSSSRPRSELIAQYFNTKAFAPNAEGTFGTAGRNILIGPGLANVDLGVFKNFRFLEHHSIQFRAEFFDLFNRPNFGQPVNTLISAAFGQIQSANTSRQIQFALKYIF